MRDPPLILVVDDVPDNVDILQMRLESQGYEVVTAGDGVEALEKTRQLLPDLILLDIMMPKMDGIETVKRLKADASLPFIPVILVTAKADGADVVAGLESGGDDYLTKPVDHAALSARVRAMLRIKALHDMVQDQAKRLEEQAAELSMLMRLCGSVPHPPEHWRGAIKAAKLQIVEEKPLIADGLTVFVCRPVPQAAAKVAPAAVKQA